MSCVRASQTVKRSERILHNEICRSRGRSRPFGGFQPSYFKSLGGGGGGGGGN